MVGIEKGPYWDFSSDFAPVKYDEWGIAWNRKFDHPLNSLDLQHKEQRGTRWPCRSGVGRLGQGHSPGHGVGGAAQHYGGQMGRYGPWVYQVKSSTLSRYGQAFLDAAVPHEDIIDYPVSYNDLIPYYKDWEMAWGVSGTNQEPFQPDSTFPIQTLHPQTPLAAAYEAATLALGYHPHPFPSSLAPVPYVNQYGVQVNACVYDGYCGEGCNYVCEVGAKANAAYRTVPAALKTGNLDLRTSAIGFRFDQGPNGNITQVRYYDAAGNIHVQPGTVFISTTMGFNIVRLALLSGIGTPYNPVTITGAVGRGAAQPTGSPSRSVTGTMAIGGNAYSAGNYGQPYQFLDLADDNFDHTGKNYIGGSRVTVGNYFGAGPGNLAIATAVSANNIGSNYKASLKDRYLMTSTTVAISPAGMVPPTTDNYLDLDPHYVDIYGDPVTRQTLDNIPNGTNCSNDQAPLYQAILQKMGATNVTLGSPAVPGTSHITSFTNHTRGGIRMGSDPTLSVFNKYGQSWTNQNFFAAGESVEPVGDNTTTGGTHPAGALALFIADGIKKYLTGPSFLV